ncbi:MAG: RsfS/YbeB/iojap family protein [Treponema sp.]|nr:RsfS/YbeB/iojap family protein [Treponema sp.]
MDDTLAIKDGFLLAKELGQLLDDHRGGDVLVMDMRSLNFWTDFFVIATASSNTHLAGLERHIKDFIQEKGLEILTRSRKPAKISERSSTELSSAELRSDEWRLLDLGTTIVHLMTSRMREFYELERLWSAAPIVYSSKSS